eukprot:s1930_g13.t2
MPAAPSFRARQCIQILNGACQVNIEARESAQSEPRNANDHSENRCSDMFRNAFRRVLSRIAAPRYLPGVLAVAVSTQHFRGAQISCQDQGKPRRIIIDTDPGVDDALAILLALASRDSLCVEGLSIALGNGKDIRALGSNAKLLLRLANASVPVSLGEVPEGDHQGAVVSRKGMKPQLVHGADHMGNVGEVVVMGGAFGERRGNRTPCAEANFFDGPEAAQAVLTADFRKVVLAGLDITHQTDMRVLRQACVESPAPLSQFVWDLCENFMNVYHDWGETFAPAHDTVPIMYLLRPDLFEGQEVRVEVETQGSLTRGMSVADWKGQWGKAANCVVLRRILDPDAYTQTFVDAIGRLPLTSE